MLVEEEKDIAKEYFGDNFMKFIPGTSIYNNAVIHQGEDKKKYISNVIFTPQGLKILSTKKAQIRV